MPLSHITMSTPQFVDLRPETLIRITQPQFPDRNEQAQEATAEDAVEAAQAAEQAQAVQVAAPQPQVAPAPVYAAPAGNCASWMAAAGITDPATALILINKESGCNPNAMNPSSGACGIGQQLPCGKWPHAWNDPVGAMIDMQAYVIARYGSWANALAFHLSNNYY